MGEDNILLLTGGTSDVGKKLLERIGKNYKKIWLHYCSSEKASKDLVEWLDGKAQLVKADFLDELEVEKMIMQIMESGAIPDQIVHLSSIKAVNKQFHRCQWEDFKREIDVSVQSIARILKSILPHMSRKKYGSIVFMLSSYTIGIPPKYQSPYIVSKYALLGLMKSISAEYASKNIRINAVSPDMMETKFLSEIPNLIIEQNAANNPLGRNQQ